MAQYKGASRQHEVSSSRRRKDTRLAGQRFSDFFQSAEGAVFGTFALPILALVLIKVPFSGELLLLLAWAFKRKFVAVDNRAFDFPYRVPKLADVNDGSYKGKKKGEGVTLFGNDLETKEQIYAGDSDLRTHQLVLGTTGSGKPQPKHAKVLTPKGWVAMGQVKVGDSVCTPDGKHAAVLRVIEQGIQPIWTIATRDGRRAQATGDHLWRVLSREPDGTEQAHTVTTDAIRALMARGVVVMLPKVRKKRGTAKFDGWAEVWKVTAAGQAQCQCIEIDHPHHLYITDDSLVTHNTELLLGIVFNALVQNTGFIYVDGKGDPKLQKEIFRLSRYLGREDDLLIINFITSGRDFVEKQVDKVTNNMNMMGNTSSGMLIELIVSLMDDSGGGGDMWKGRAIMFVAALTRPLTYLRDKGHINLSPEKYLEYFELNIIEELVWEHGGKYGDMFDVIVAPLRSYLLTLPGYQKAKLKKQETKTLEQHGYIVMQLGRIFNDLTFNYGHIFKTRVGDVDFYDVVINRRLLVVLLPALERAPDSMRMLGKMIVGSIKQMMAGCLGNRVEGVVREIIDSRPTGSEFPFYTILDEYGYYAVVGFAVAPAQARSLGFSVTFAAQDFSSLKKSSAEEADATWENTNIRAVGRLTSGTESETWRRVQGAAAESSQAMVGNFERSPGGANEKLRQSDNVAIEQRSRLNYDDVAMQENGEFTFLIGKKSQNGKTGGVALIRGLGFYTAGPAPKEMRINDFIPVEPPEPSDLPQSRASRKAFVDSLKDGSFAKRVRSVVKGDPTFARMHSAFEHNYADADRPVLGRLDTSFAVLGAYLSGSLQKPPAAAPLPVTPAPEAVAQVAVAPAPTPQPDPLSQASIEASLLAVADMIAETAVAPVVAAPDEKVLDAAWEGELAIAEPQQLLDMQLMAAGEGFESLSDKWAAQERIQTTCDAIARETAYVIAPEPEALGVAGVRKQLSDLDARCRELIKVQPGN
ncbi:TraM recognition domain-containing protein [Pseudomonas sp. HN2-3]|uniref:TraM recognition domain-containing protein n=1 Tax=Pseudomonas sp. HN2-3 TaxID=2886360 RepID=UPI001D0F5C3F|nr:TraM recognition domain-containing protein [Pseudomonas sp. HN2-3]UDU80712.1 TraM recognition domain-containing protein [Pseudomonas sp. HN2-3]